VIGDQPQLERRLTLQCDRPLRCGSRAVFLARVIVRPVPIRSRLLDTGEATEPKWGACYWAQEVTLRKFHRDEMICGVSDPLG